MAKVKYGPVVAQVSGSVGGTVFSRNRAGTYMRTRAIPTDPNSTAQQNVRAILAGASQAWADLTAAQRAAWENWAGQNPVTDVLGASILLSGHQAYVRINARLDLDGQTVLTTPPIVNAPLALDSLALSADIGVGAFGVTFTATPLDANIELWLSAAVVNSAGITYIRNLLRFTGTSTAAATSPYDNQGDIEAIFGSLVVGQNVHVRASTFDTTTGLLSVALEAKDIVESTT